MSTTTTQRLRLPGCRPWTEIERGVYLSECNRFRIEASRTQGGEWILFDTAEISPRQDGTVWTQRFRVLADAMRYAERL